MSDVSVVIERTINKNGLSDSDRHVYTAAMSVVGLGEQTLAVGTAVQSIYTANMATLGLAFAQSLVTSTATTATIEIGRLDGTTLYSFCRLRPNEGAVLRFAGGSYGTKADAAGARLFVSIAED